MEPFSLLAAAGAFLAAEAAKKVGGTVVDTAFNGVKSLLRKCVGRDPKPEDFAPAALQKAHLDVQPVFVEQARAAVARSSALRRAELVKRALDGASVLWVDDVPQNNAYEQRTLAALGMRLDLATSTAEALSLVGRSAHDVILSDMARDTPDAGLVLLRRLRDAGCRTEVVFYVGRVDPSRPIPAGAFGIAADPESLLHLVFDVLERHRV
jgi:CheY-like chemotaxis protein